MRPVLLLGAGASFSSGVPVAGEMVRQIARYAIASERGRNPEMSTDIMESDVRRYLKKYSWGKDENFPEMFPYAVEELLTPTTKRRAFFDQVILRARSPGEGYQAVARLMQRELVHTVLTTNFDSLIEESLRSLAPHSRSITTVNRVKGDAVNFAPYKRNQIIYLHGAVEFYTDRNTIEETERLDNSLVDKARSVISYAPLIVIGYRGFEPSVMKHLLEEGIEGSDRYKHGIYWCTKRDSALHPNVTALAQRVGTNFFVVDISDFDEAMLELDTILTGRAGFQAVDASPAPVPAGFEDASFDKTISIDLGMEDLQSDLLFATAKTYAKTILRIDLEPTQLERFLEANEFAQRDSTGALRPTLGLYLLTGQDVSSRFPHLKTLIVRGGKKQQAFEGNILSQFEQLRTELLSEGINGLIRVKLPSGAVEIAPYNERALVELLVNLLAHRDYSSRESSFIRIEAGASITFTTPGGLLPEVFRKLRPDKEGRFLPVMNVYQVRNPVISDILHSQGVMDKAGSGLADVAKLMTEHYGAAEFSAGMDNKCVTVTLKQASSSGDSVGRTATPVNKNVTYLTNVLPFLSFPSTVYSFPLEERYAKRGGERFPPIDEGDEANKVAFRPFEGELWLLADPRAFPYFSQLGYVGDYTRERKFDEVVVDRRNVIVSLLRMSWESKLRQVDANLRVEYRARRAYFVKKDDDGYTIVYDSAQRKNVQRGVVKKREGASSIEYENEGIYYSVVQYGESWGVQIKHFYVFTDSTGVDPLVGSKQTRRATRRYKFDRNPAVKADLQFWTTYLSDKQPTIDIGLGSVPGLVLSSVFLSAEAIEV